jgi:hypothetical protein
MLTCQEAVRYLRQGYPISHSFTMTPFAYDCAHTFTISVTFVQGKIYAYFSTTCLPEYYNTTIQITWRQLLSYLRRNYLTKVHLGEFSFQAA